MQVDHQMLIYSSSNCRNCYIMSRGKIHTNFALSLRVEIRGQWLFPITASLLIQKLRQLYTPAAQTEGEL